MFKRILYSTFNILCLILTVSAMQGSRLTRTQSEVVCTGDSCSMQRAVPADVAEPTKKYNRFTYNKARFGNFMQQKYHQVKRVGYLAEGKYHKLFGAIDEVDKARARLHKGKVEELKKSQEQLKANFKEQRQTASSSSGGGGGRAPQLARSSTVAGIGALSRNVYSPSRE